MDLRKLTALELGSAIRAGACTAVDAARQALDAIRAKNGATNAFITLLPERQIMERAGQVQKKIEAGELTSPLAGVPYAVKDNLCTEGIRTTCASGMLRDFVPPDTATAVRRLEEAGGILLGKLNMDEFGMGATSEHSYFGPVRNPWDKARSAGGSSGGSAAAVAAGMGWYALGTDTGGSVRQPAACCGVTGFKPSYGEVSRYGLIAYASSMDQIGPMARTAEDCRAVWEIIRGKDPKDATTGPLPRRESETRRVGLVKDPFRLADPDLEARTKETLDRLNIQWEETELPLMEESLGAYYTIASAEASSNLARYDGVRLGRRAEDCRTPAELIVKSRTEGFGREVKKRILMGTFALYGEGPERCYDRACRLRRSLSRELDELFSRYDLLLLPTMAVAAPLLGREKRGKENYQKDGFTVFANLAGLPAISVPWGFDEAGLPLGLQLAGPRGGDERVLALAERLQRSARWQNGCPEERGGGN